MEQSRSGAAAEGVGTCHHEVPELAGVQFRPQIPFINRPGQKVPESESSTEGQPQQQNNNNYSIEKRNIA